MKVDLTEVIEAIDSADDLAEYVYYIPYEEIMMRQGTHYIGADLPEDFDETAEPSDFIALPTRREINDYENMEKFADQYEDDDIAQWLVNSLKGKGAFRRFRAVLERFTIEDEWYDFLELQHKVKAMEWCEEHGIEYHDDTLRFEKHTEETAAKTQSSLRLIPVNDDNYLNLVFMAADFRAAMAKGRGRKAKSNPDEAQYDLEDLMDEGCTLYAVGDHGRFIGYMVLKDDGFTVSLTELYVQPDRRRGGVAGDDKQLDAARHEQLGDLERISAHGLHAFRAVGHAGRVAQVEERFVGQQAAHGVEHRHAAHAGIENADG